MKLSEMIITETMTILEAMERLDKNGTKVLFLQSNGKLEAALTDGDIRRYILTGKELTARVSEAANYQPKYLEVQNRRRATVFMKQHHIEAVPIVNESMEIASISLLDSSIIVTTKDKVDIPIVMMAGGLGTRLYPYTKVLPKPLIPVGENPIAEIIINKFCNYGCHRFFMIVNHKKNMIKAYFNEIEKKYELEFIDENKPLGTGGGLSLMKGKLKETFFLSNCDTLIEEDIAKIYELHKNEGNMITMICSLKNFTIPYGVIDIGENGDIANIREKPNLTFFTNTGCYVVEPEVLEYLEHDTPIGFPDILERLKKEGKKVGVYPISECSWMDMGQLDELEKMRNRLELQY
ncbi:nucleotidyltransferase family protein [Lachnoclostridium sp.]|uniref:nucleotidyltransferase family protein n=1 Tax=Lachnoclostridium sp. TaxID=2028282 RepID=UPI00289F0F0E|nr:nucleotidyltransferase family protein [Lachnoclostridium sp.]